MPGGLLSHRDNLLSPEATRDPETMAGVPVEVPRTYRPDALEHDETGRRLDRASAGSAAVAVSLADG